MTDSTNCPCGDNDGQWCSRNDCPYPAPMRSVPDFPLGDFTVAPSPITRKDTVFVIGLVVLVCVPWFTGVFYLAAAVWDALT